MRMLYSRRMKLTSLVTVLLVCVMSLFLPTSAAAQSAASDAPDYSGMYSFVKDGEFMQITLEDKGAVSGFISRYGDSSTEKGTFLDQFIKSGTANGAHVTFATDSVHGVSYTFDGAFARGPGKTPQEDGYYILRGTLTRNVASADGKSTTQNQQVEFRSFPRDADAPQ